MTKGQGEVTKGRSLRSLRTGKEERGSSIASGGGCWSTPGAKQGAAVPLAIFPEPPLLTERETIQRQLLGWNESQISYHAIKLRSVFSFVPCYFFLRAQGERPPGLLAFYLIAHIRMFPVQTVSSCRLLWTPWEQRLSSELVMPTAARSTA